MSRQGKEESPATLRNKIWHGKQAWHSCFWMVTALNPSPALPQPFWSTVSTSEAEHAIHGAAELS